MRCWHYSSDCPEVQYPPTIQKYRNSLFNFIFIPQPLNSSLSNEGLFIKVAEIHTHENEIKCSYSKGYYGLLNKSPRMYFQRYPTEKEIDSFSTEEDARAYLNEYFTKTFPEEFLQFSTALVALPTVSWALFSKILSWNFRSLSTRLPARWISKNGRLLQISFLWYSIR